MIPCDPNGFATDPRGFTSVTSSKDVIVNPGSVTSKVVTKTPESMSLTKTLRDMTVIGNTTPATAL